MTLPECMHDLTGNLAYYDFFRKSHAPLYYLVVHCITTGVVKKFHAKSGRPGSVIPLQSITHSTPWTQYLFLFLERENSISNRDIKCRKSRVIGMPNTSTMFCLARGRRRLWGMMRSLWNSDGNFYTTPIILKLLCVCVFIWFDFLLLLRKSTQDGLWNGALKILC